MGKTVRTIYTCDRCGVEMSADMRNRFGLRKYKYIYEFSVYTTAGEFEEELCLCPKCGNGLKKFLKGGGME